MPISLFDQFLELKQALGNGAANAGTADDGYPIMGTTTTSRAEIRQFFPVRAAGTSMRFAFFNDRINFTSTANQADMETSAAVRRRVGGTPSGSFVSAVTNLSVPKAVAVISDPFNVTVAPGDELEIDCYGKSMTAGKYISSTRQSISPGYGAIGDSLPYTGDGSVSGDFYQDDVWCPGLALVPTRSQGLGAFGHSNVVARITYGNSGPSYAADALGLSFASFGIGGSIPTAWNNNANFDVAQLISRNFIFFGMINACNNLSALAAFDGLDDSVIPTYTGAGWSTSLADMFKKVTQRLSAYGIRVFAITENYPGPDPLENPTVTARRRRAWDLWNNWLMVSGAAYCGGTLAGAIDTRYAFASTPYKTGTPLSTPGYDDPNPAVDDLHANHKRIGYAIRTYFGPGGAGASYLVPDSNNIVEVVVDPLWGVLGTPGTAGALPAGFVEWKYTDQSHRLTLDGFGAIKVVSPTTRTTYMLYNTALGGSDAAKTFVVRATSAPWTPQTDNQGLHIGIHSVGGTTVSNATHAAGGVREGYFFKFSNFTTSLRMHTQRFNSVNDQSAYGVASSVNAKTTTYAGHALASGDVITVQIVRTLSVGNNSFEVQVYKNGLLIGTTTITDATTTASFRGDLFVSIGSAGDTSTTHTNNGRLWDWVQLGKYDATVISGVTGPDILYAIEGGRVPVEAVASQSSPSIGPAGGVTVTAGIAGISGATVGSAVVTDGSGIARFSQADGVYIPDSASVGDTAVLTFNCGGQFVDIPVEVVAGVTGGPSTPEDVAYGVTISPVGAEVDAGATQAFTGTLLFSGTPDESLTPSVVEVGGGTIDGAGLYTAPSTPGMYTVRFTSVFDTDIYGEAKVFVPEAASIIGGYGTDYDYDPTPFDEVRFDTQISYGAHGGPSFSTVVVTQDSGADSRIQRWAVPKGRWEISSGIKSNIQMRAVQEFFIARQGKARGFRFKDWLDYNIYEDATQECLVLTSTTFQMCKRYASGSQTVVRKISKPVTGTVKVWDDEDVEVTTGWTVDTATGIITFSSSPSYIPKVSCQFDVPVRFDTDAFDSSMDAFNTNAWNSIPVVELLM